MALKRGVELATGGLLVCQTDHLILGDVIRSAERNPAYQAKSLSGVLLAAL